MQNYKSLVRSVNKQRKEMRDVTSFSVDHSYVNQKPPIPDLIPNPPEKEEEDEDQEFKDEEDDMELEAEEIDPEQVETLLSLADKQRGLLGDSEEWLGESVKLLYSQSFLHYQSALVV